MFSVAGQIVRICWGIFAIVWLIAAFINKRSVYREDWNQRLRYVVVLAVGWFLLFKGYQLGWPFNLRVVPHSDVVAILSATLAVVGLLFCLWARLTLGRNWSGTITLKEDHQLIEHGPYHFVRHPIYTGLLVMLIGTILLIGTVASLIGGGLAFAGLWIKSGYEETVMVQQFSDRYRAYRRRVKRIIPYVF